MKSENKQIHIISIRQIIIEKRFDEVVEATKRLCQIVPGAKIKSTPSLALKMGHSMKKLAGIIINHSIRNGDDEARKNAKMYLLPQSTEWSRRISRYALHALAREKESQSPYTDFRSAGIHQVLLKQS